MPSRRQVIDDQLYAHFITFAIYRRRRLFDQDHPKRIFLGVLNRQLASFHARCVGYVIMPNHVHLIAWLPATHQLGRFMHGLKRISSFHIRQWCRDNNANYFRSFGEGIRFWQPRYHSFEIYERAKLEEKLQYMHENPVRAGLVQQASDWPWSSARWYESRRSVGVPIRWIE